MNRLQRIRRISGWLRRLTLLLAVALVGAVAFALGVPGQTLITLGNGQLNQLLGSGAFGGSAAIAVFAPMGLLLALGLYWLQRLFGEYQRGHFFTDGNMRCYLWLVWLKVAWFAYSLLWPPVVAGLVPAVKASAAAVTVELGTLVELAVLVLIVHVLREAQRLHDENEAFV